LAATNNVDSEFHFLTQKTVELVILSSRLIDRARFNFPPNTLYRGRVFKGQMTQPTVSKHWRIRLQSHQVHPTVLKITTQYETKTHKIHTDKHK